MASAIPGAIHQTRFPASMFMFFVAHVKSLLAPYDAQPIIPPDLAHKAAQGR
jgi:hypothetical protein